MAEKKYSVLAVLKVLQEYSDEEHPLQMKEIQAYVKEKHKIDISAKTIRSDIAALKSFGFDIHNKGSFDRTIEHGDGTVLDSRINKDWYLAGPISDEDIEILFNGLLSERYLPDKYFKELAQKLESLSSSVDFVLNIKGAAKVKRDFINWERLYGNLKLIREAASLRKVVSYKYDNPESESSSIWGSDYTRYISPCRIFKQNGGYYLIGCSDYGSLKYLRIENMFDVDVSDWKKYNLIGMIGYGLTLPDFSNRRFKLIPDKSMEITFKFPKSLKMDAADYYGNKSMIFRASEEDKNNIIATVYAPEEAVLKFTLMNSPNVEILSPDSLRYKAGELLRKAAEKHESVL